MIIGIPDHVKRRGIPPRTRNAVNIKKNFLKKKGRWKDKWAETRAAKFL